MVNKITLIIDFPNEIEHQKKCQLKLISGNQHWFKNIFKNLKSRNYKTIKNYCKQQY